MWLGFWGLGFSFAGSSLPAMFVFPALAFVLNRRTSQQVAEALAPLQAMVQGMQGGVKSLAERDAKVDEMKALLRRVQAEYGDWQLLLRAQIEGQLGMLDYARGMFDAARPQLEAASTWDWTSQVALACARWRSGDLEGAWKALDVAARAGPKEPLVYAVGAILRLRKEQREEALTWLRKGLEGAPESAVLKTLRDRIANKEKVSPAEVLGQAWYQFFPEELPAPPPVMVRGMRGPPPEGVQVQMLMPPPMPKARGKLAKRR